MSTVLMTVLGICTSVPMPVQSVLYFLIDLAISFIFLQVARSFYFFFIGIMLISFYQLDTI